MGLGGDGDKGDGTSVLLGFGVYYPSYFKVVMNIDGKAVSLVMSLDHNKPFSAFVPNSILEFVSISTSSQSSVIESHNRPLIQDILK